MHGELVLLAGATAGVVSWAVATALERSHVLLDRLASLTERAER